MGEEIKSYLEEKLEEAMRKYKKMSSLTEGIFIGGERDIDLSQTRIRFMLNIYRACTELNTLLRLYNGETNDRRWIELQESMDRKILDVENLITGILRN